jgi:thiol:disulfide interchange protein DsbA
MTRARRAAWTAFIATCIALAGTAGAANFDIEGKYELVSPAQPTITPGKVEVVDVFWYGCPHCYKFKPKLEEYARNKPDYVEVVRMPAIFNKTWELHARAYYAAKALGAKQPGLEEALHQAIFKAIHVDRQRLATKNELAALFERHGVARQAFDRTFESFAVESGVRRSMVMQSRYGVRGTPSVIVNGKYRVSGSLAGSYDDMVKVIGILADKEHRLLTAAR